MLVKLLLIDSLRFVLGFLIDSSLFGPKAKILDALYRETMIPLYDVCSELINVLEHVHLIHYCVEPLGPELLVKEYPEQKSFFPVLVLNESEF